MAIRYGKIEETFQSHTDGAFPSVNGHPYHPNKRAFVTDVRDEFEEAEDPLSQAGQCNWNTDHIAPDACQSAPVQQVPVALQAKARLVAVLVHMK